MNEHTVRMFSPPRSKWASWLALALILFLAWYPSPAFPWSPVSRDALGFSEPDYREAGEFLQANTKLTAVVMSDAYWFTSWYGDRASLWCPVDMKTLEEIEKEFVAVDAVLLTPMYIGTVAKTDAIWLSLYNSPKPFGDFQVVKEFVSSKGLRVVLFLKSGG